MIAEAVLCMALTVHHEARGEPYVGREAVAHVLYNRAKQEETGVCWEAFRYKAFSWTLHPSKLHTLPSGKAWEDSIKIARRVYEGNAADFTGGANHFHVVGLTPRPCWAGAGRVVGQWGDHIFYRIRPDRVYNECTRSRRVAKTEIKVPNATTQGGQHAQRLSH